MTLPPEERTRFSIYTVESPSARDLYSGRGEGDLLRQITGLNAIPCTHRVAPTRGTFEVALSNGFEEHIQKDPTRLPILHISAHGDGDCIELTDGTQIIWEQLKDLLRPVNARVDGNLIVCMSSCQGYSGTRMAMHPGESDYPYFALIGSYHEPTWGETAVAFATFYHQLHRGELIEDAVRAMKAASGNDSFLIEHSSHTRGSYISFLAAQDTPSIPVVPAGSEAFIWPEGANNLRPIPAGSILTSPVDGTDR